MKERSCRTVERLVSERERERGAVGQNRSEIGKRRSSERINQRTHDEEVVVGLGLAGDVLGDAGEAR